MKSILLIQFRSDETLLQERKCFRRYFDKKNVKLDFLDILETKANFSSPEKFLENYQAVILGGSGEFYFSGNKGKKKKIFQKMLKRIAPLIKYILKNDFPSLGVCFGHQMLGYFLGEKVVNDSFQAETGSFSVFLTKNGEKNHLFFGVPRNFIAQFGHRDSLEKLPKGTKLLAKSKRCKIVAFVYKKNIYGIQFHPEMELRDVKFRLNLHPEHRGKKETPLLISPLSPKVLENFLKIAYAN